MGCIEGENYQGVDRNAMLAVELSEVEKYTLVKVGLADGLVFDVNQDHLIERLLAFAGGGARDRLIKLDFYQEVNGFAIAIQQIGEVLLGQKFNAFWLNLAEQRWGKEFQEV
jgi:hypothetical protein